MEDQERELLEGYRQLKPESRRFIMSTIVTAVRAESAVKRQYGLPLENGQEKEGCYGDCVIFCPNK